MRRPPSIIDRRSVASARAPLATLRPLRTPSGYTRRNRLGGSTWWQPGRAAAGGHACLVTDPVGVGWHGGAPPSPPAAGCPWRTPRGTLWGGRLVVCRRERRGRRAEGSNRGGRGQRARRRRSRAATWSASWRVSQYTNRSRAGRSEPVEPLPSSLKRREGCAGSNPARHST